MDHPIHVCFATGQPDANLLPILASKSKVEKVFLITTPGMKERAEWFQNSLRGQVKVEICHLKNDSDMDEVQEVLQNYLAENEGKVIVNITGGTKLITVPTYVVCSSFKIPFFYLELKTFQLWVIENFSSNSWLPPRTEQIDKNTVWSANYFKIFIEARGFELKSIEEWKGRIPEHQDYFDFIMKDGSADKKEKLLKGIKYLNNTAAIVANTKYKELDAPIAKDEILEFFLDKVTSYEWVKYSKKPYEKEGRLAFKDKETAVFLAGKWFEEYCAQLIKSIHPAVKLFNATVVRGKMKNELDIIFLYNGKLHIVEIKTANLREETKAQEYIYKLNTLKENLGGKSAKVCLLSLEAISGVVRERAKEYDITCIQGVACAQNELVRQLKHWMDK